MFKYLFFDDQRLYRRENCRRELGTPRIVPESIYRDPYVDTTLCTSAVFKCDDGKYHMIYMGFADDDVGRAANVACDTYTKVKRRAFVVAAISDDGIHFQPRLTGKESCEVGEPRFPHSVSDDRWDLGELGCVIEDKNPASPDERYKALVVTSFKEEEGRHRDYIMASGDLIHWHKMEGVTWHEQGTEPIVSAFYNNAKDCFTIICRPDCGERRVGYSLTKDFRTFTVPTHCLQCDSEDEPLAELYGMNAFEYDGWYIGMPLLYCNLKQIVRAKGDHGCMKAHLAYSVDGLHFQRCFHKPLFDGFDEEDAKTMGRICPMVWPNWYRRLDDGSILIYSVNDACDHEGFFRTRDLGRIVAYKLREDGFVKLVAEPGKQAFVATRDNLWNGGELTVNLKTTGPATVQVYVNPNGTPERISGFTHECCEPFYGDSTQWHPTWTGGTMDQFKGQIVVIEVKLPNGELYSISGDMTPMMFVEARKYAQFGTLPTRKGW